MEKDFGQQEPRSGARQEAGEFAKLSMGFVESAFVDQEPAPEETDVQIIGIEFQRVRARLKGAIEIPALTVDFGRREVVARGLLRQFEVGEDAGDLAQFAGVARGAPRGETENAPPVLVISGTH